MVASVGRALSYSPLLALILLPSSASARRYRDRSYVLVILSACEPSLVALLARFVQLVVSLDNLDSPLL